MHVSNRLSDAGRVARLVVVAILCAATPSRATPDVAVEPPPIVRAVEIRAHLAGALDPSVDLEALVEIVPGEPLDAEAVRRTLENLHATGLFARAEALRAETETPGTIDLVFVLVPPVRVGEIRFESDALSGTDPPRERLLRRRLEIRSGEILDDARVEASARAFEAFLRERGFPSAAVDATIVQPGNQGARKRFVDLVFHLAPGSRATVGAVRFEGNIGPFERPLLAAALGLDPGTPYDPEALDEARRGLRRFFVDQGHLSARVAALRPEPDATGTRVDLVVSLDAGAPYEIELHGLERDELEPDGDLPLFDDRPLDAARLERACERLREDLQRRGHYHASVDCRIETVEAADSVDPSGASTGRRLRIRRLVVEVEPGPVFEVAAVRFPGELSVPVSTLESLVRVGEKRFLSPGSGRLVSRELREDLENLRSFYRLRGHARVEVGPSRVLELGEGFLEIEIPIVEGPRQRVVDLEIEGIDGATTSLETADLLARLPLRPGGGFHPVLLEDSLNVIRTLYEEEGHPRARVESILDWDDEELLVDIVLRVDPGPKRVLDRLILRGLRDTRASLVRLYADLEPGEVLSRRRLLRAERDLFRLGVFSEVDVALAADPGEDGRRDVVIRVEEGRPWRLAYGLSYHSDDGIGALLGVTRHNLRGRGERLQLDLRASQNDRRLRLLYDQPAPFGIEVPLTYTFFLRDETRESYAVEETGGRLSFTRDVERRRWGLVYDYRLVELEQEPLDPTALEREDTEVEISSLAPNLFVDRRDDPLDPTRGWSLAAQVEVAFPLFDAETELVKLFAQHTRYASLGDWGVLAGSLRAGAIEPTGSGRGEDPVLPDTLPSSRVPISERFFAGGRTTHRAFERDRLGRLGETLIERDDGSLVEAGGNGLMLLNVDYRFPVAGALGGVVFFDLGNVWADWRDLDPGELRAGAGVGLRYRSPVGPIRLEIGWKLDREPFEESSPVFFLSFGNPF